MSKAFDVLQKKNSQKKKVCGSSYMYDRKGNEWNMKINIYYGGRGLIDDPTIYVMNKIQEVLEELRVKVERINLFEQKNAITTLPQGMADADGIILATTVEWFGIGG